MKLTDLKSKGAFVSPDLVEKEVAWTHKNPATGKPITDKFTVFIRVLSYGQVEQVIQALPDDPERSYNASLISKSVVLGDGTETGSESFTYEDAYQLDPSLAYALISAVNEVNQRGSVKKKPLRPPKKSGTSSSSTASAGGPSAKPKNE